MGIGLWIVSAAICYFAIRYIKFAKPAGWFGELIAVFIAALVLGAIATALDFGGWNEPDWRAALFVLFGSLAIAGAIRVIRLARIKE